MFKQKREQIIDAAYQVISDKGYEKASIKDIAHAADITPGLVHYYFHNKEDILVELLNAISRQYTLDMQYLLTTVPSEKIANAALNEPKERVERQPEWYKIRYELFALGLRSPNISERVNALLENARSGIDAVLQKVFNKSKGETSPVAAILLACFDGLALQKMLDPEFDLDRCYLALGEMVNAFMNNPE